MYVLKVLLLYASLSMHCATAAISDSPGSLSQLPSCANGCFTASTGSENCSSLQCFCTNEPLYASVTHCYETSCTTIDYLESMNATSTICNAPIEYRKNIQIVVASVFQSLVVVCITLRLLVRPPFSAAFGCDDALALLAFCSTTSFNIMVIITALRGWGKDMWALTISDIIRVFKLFYVQTVLYLFSVNVSKLSILAFYTRIFTSKSFRVQNNILITLCLLYWVVFTFLTAFNCNPASYFWNKFDLNHHGKCISTTVYKISPAINIALDIAVMVLPLQFIMPLHLSPAKKIRASLMFCVGILVTIVSALRLKGYYILLASKNTTYDGTQVAYYSAIECSISVICTCMPPIAMLLRRFLPKCFGSSEPDTYPRQVDERAFFPQGATSIETGDAQLPTAPKAARLSGNGDDVDLADMSSVSKSRILAS